MARRPRYPFEVPARVQTLPGRSEAGSFAASTRDLGEGGLCLVTEEEMPLGQPLKIHLELGPPSNRPIDLLARVVWARPLTSNCACSPPPEAPRWRRNFRCGVRIELLEVPHALQLQRELERLAKRQARAALEISI